MSHVIEHVPDPVETLTLCHDLLRPGGRLIVVAPNSESLGRRWFRRDWLGWDVPRHLYTFTMNNLESCAHRAEFEVTELRTTARSCFHMLPSIRVLATASETARSRGLLRVATLGLWLGEHLASRFSPCGEEILMIARRPA
jgi:SAM-dependent methyltransferase